MIVRSDNRGLGIQSFELWRHLIPEKTLIVDIPDPYGYQRRVERYPDARMVACENGRLPDDAINWLLDDVDVFLTCETPYDYRLLERARAVGVKTAIQFNYEFFRWAVDPHLPQPDLFIAPSTWHLERLADFNIVHLPTPVARDRLPFQRRRKVERVLHVAGHPAVGDRNGTRLFLAAASRIQTPLELTIKTQHAVPTAAYRARRCRVERADVSEYPDLYEDADLLVQPRRYGGQSLPMQEALACGIPVISLDVEPQRGFLPRESLVEAAEWSKMMMQSGEITAYTAHPAKIAARVDEIATNPDLYQRLVDHAEAFAERMSWETLGPEWLKTLEGLM